MRATLFSLIAGTALAAALPAIAQPAPGYDNGGYDNRAYDNRGSDDRGGYDRGNSDRGGYDRGYDNDRPNADWARRGYAGFSDEYARIERRIDRGLREGSYDRRQADVFRQTARDIRTRARIQRDRGRFDPRETQVLLDRLQDRMRVAMHRGREQNAQYGDRHYRR